MSETKTHKTSVCAHLDKLYKKNSPFGSRTHRFRDNEEQIPPPQLLDQQEPQEFLFELVYIFHSRS